jgi:hypothetical protein
MARYQRYMYVSSSLGSWKWVLLKAVYCLPGREAIMLYMRGLPDQQIFRVSSLFFAHTIIEV